MSCVIIVKASMMRLRSLSLLIILGCSSAYGMQALNSTAETPQEKRTALTTLALITLSSTALGATALYDCYKHTVGECSQANRLVTSACAFAALSSGSLFLKKVWREMQPQATRNHNPQPTHQV